MVTGNPWQIGKGRIPGTEPEGRFHAPPTGQMDPPEDVEACLACPLKECMEGSFGCPLTRKPKPGKKTRAGAPDGRSRKRPPVENHGLSLEGESTVEEFIELTRNAYGGEVIRALEEAYGEVSPAGEGRFLPHFF